jgi:hypothetical protein
MTTLDSPAEVVFKGTAEWIKPLDGTSGSAATFGMKDSSKKFASLERPGQICCDTARQRVARTYSSLPYVWMHVMTRFVGCGGGCLLRSIMVSTQGRHMHGWLWPAHCLH